MKDGGAEGDRTPDLRIANATLSQLSYGPVISMGETSPASGRRGFMVIAPRSVKFAPRQGAREGSLFRPRPVRERDGVFLPCCACGDGGLPGRVARRLGLGSTI